MPHQLHVQVVARTRDEFPEVLIRVPVGDLHVCRDKIKSPGAVKSGPCLPNHWKR